MIVVHWIIKWHSWHWSHVCSEGPQHINLFLQREIYISVNGLHYPCNIVITITTIMERLNEKKQGVPPINYDFPTVYSLHSGGKSSYCSL